MRRMLAAVCALGLLILWAAPAAWADDEARLRTAQQTADAWLAEIDAGSYGACWEACGPMLQQKMDRETWEEALTQGRGRLGAMQVRSLINTELERNPEGAPPGIYAALEYAVEYEHGAVKELVVLREEGDGWKVAGYILR